MTQTTVTIPASLPVAGLPGLDAGWSRLVDTVDASGAVRRFHVLDTGAVDDQVGTLLCVHGNPTWSYLWRRLLATPPVGWRVVAVDQLGMGWSDRIGRIRRLAERIDDLDRLGSALEITGPVVTLAHDWGGPVSLGWALAHRDQLAGVVLTNTAVHQPEGSPAPALIRMARTPAMLAAVCRTTPTFVRGTTALSTPRPARDVRDAFAAPYSTPALRQAVADFVADIPLEPDHPSMPTLSALAEDVSSLDVPVLLAWGPRDPVFSDRYLRDLVERLPHADVHRYEGASHLVTEDAPAALDDIRSWIERLPARTSTGDESAATAPEPAATDLPRRPMGAALADRAADELLADRPAVVELGGAGSTVTWRELDRRVTDLAAGLDATGVRRGDRVALLVPPGADLAAAVYACWRIGAVVVVADAGLGARGLARALRGAWPQHLIAIDRGLLAARALRIGGRRYAAGSLSPGRARLLGARETLDTLVARGRGRPLPEPPGPEDEAAVVFTSGATGPAKGVVYRHRQVEANRDALIRLYALTAEDRLVAAFAPFALYGPAMGIASAVPDMDVTSPATLTATRLAEAVQAVSATLIWASPASLRHVVETRGDLTTGQRTALGGVRLLMSAGAPVPSALLRDMLTLLPAARAHTPYGMTEVLPVTDIDLTERELVGDGDGVCVGSAVDGADVRICPLDAAGLPGDALTDSPGRTGEIVVRAPWAKDRYDRLAATQAASAHPEGWHRTGDVGHLDDDGRLWVEGRLAHVVSTASGPLTPVGVEQRVESLPDVDAAACVGVGPAGTQVVVLVVVPKVGVGRRDRLASPELAARVRGAAKVDVAAVLVRRALPVDVRHNSKVDRSALSRWAEDQLS